MMLIGLVGLALDRQVLRKPPLCLEQPLGRERGIGCAWTPTMLIELMARLAQPPLAALHSSDDRLRIKLELHAR